jgi:hypothetical protein
MLRRINQTRHFRMDSKSLQHLTLLARHGQKFHTALKLGLVTNHGTHSQRLRKKRKGKFDVYPFSQTYFT